MVVIQPCHMSFLQKAAAVVAMSPGDTRLLPRNVPCHQPTWFACFSRSRLFNWSTVSICCHNIWSWYDLVCHYPGEFRTVATSTGMGWDTGMIWDSYIFFGYRWLFHSYICVGTPSNCHALGLLIFFFTYEVCSQIPKRSSEVYLS